VRKRWTYFANEFLVRVKSNHTVFQTDECFLLAIGYARQRLIREDWPRMRPDARRRDSFSIPNKRGSVGTLIYNTNLAVERA
jgi:hypothetical protein